MLAVPTKELARDQREPVAPHDHSGLYPVPTTTEDTREADELTLGELLQEDFATYNGKLTEPGLWAVVAHRLGARSATSQSRVEKTVLGSAHRVLSAAVSLTWGIDLPKQVKLGRRVRIWHFGCVRLNARAIGNDVHIRHDTNLGPLHLRDADPTQLPVIEDRADLGVGVCIMGDVRVGHDTLVGANSLVIKNVPPNSMVLGVPARALPR